MEQKKEYNIKFIKISSIIYTLGLLYIPVSSMIEHSYTSGGGNNGGGGGAIYALALVILIATMAIIILNFIFSKPKPKEKYLRFLPLYILIIFALLAIALTIGRIIGMLFIIGGIFLIKYTLSKSNWSDLIKMIIVLPVLAGIILKLVTFIEMIG